MKVRFCTALNIMWCFYVSVSDISYKHARRAHICFPIWQEYQPYLIEFISKQQFESGCAKVLFLQFIAVTIFYVSVRVTT
jgi:hypothetical protein